jgi:uncharacterized protein (TIGR01777 family)
MAGTIDATALEAVDAVVHLAGENIASGRWTASKRARIRDSRVRGTHLLAQTLAAMTSPPRAFLSASAIGIYGDRGDELLHEESATGEGFLATLGREWEAAADPARERGIRVVCLRLGVVLSPRGGALAKMLPPFRLGLGGVLGKGSQWFSWIALEDALTAIEHLLTAEAVQGPVNLVAPRPVTNREFTKTLGRVLRRPTICPVPSVLLRLAFGKMADEALLASVRVEPRVLQEAGFQFAHPQLEEALRHGLHRAR